MLSTADGDWVDGGELDADYWYRNLRQTVLFQPAVARLVDQQYRVFIEVSAHPAIGIGIEETLDTTGVNAVVLGTLHRDEGGLDRMLTSLAEAFVRGVPVTWPDLFPTPAK